MQQPTSRIRRISNSRPETWKLAWPLLACMLLPALLRPATSARAADDFGFEDAVLEGFEELDKDLSEAWWNPQWKYRQKLLIDSPRVALPGRRPLFLEGLNPLLLADSGLVRRDLRDVRFVTLDGIVLESGVVRFPNDDGTCFIWVIPPAQGPVRSPWNLMLYMGNDKAGPPPGKRVYDEPLTEWTVPVRVSPVELAQGASLPEVRPLFDDLVVLEAENMLTEAGDPLPWYRRRAEPGIAYIGRDGTSGGLYVAPGVPWRDGTVPGPQTAKATVQLPRSGQWYVHVRYLVSIYNSSSHGHAPRALRKAYFPFTLQVGTQTVQAGTNQDWGAHYRWQRLPMNLDAGPTDIRITFDRPGAVDAIVLTQRQDYLPDYRDLTGPVWMRFRIVDKDAPPSMLRLYAVHTPWSSHGPQGDDAAYFFANTTVPRRDLAMDLVKDPENLLKPGQWSVWAQAPHSRGILWWCEVSVESGMTRRRTSNDTQTLEYQFATAPHPSRAFTTGTGTLGYNSRMNILMPSSLDYTAVSRTRTFEQWARDRVATARSLGLTQHPRPENFWLTTMVRVNSNPEFDASLEAIRLAGFHAIDGRLGLPGQWQLMQKHDLDHGSTAHHWYHATVSERLSDGTLQPNADLPVQPEAGKTALETLRGYLASRNAVQFRPEHRRWGPPENRVRMLIMGDEVSPSVSAQMINELPLMHAVFVEYLQQQGLSPSFFGVTSWEALRAHDGRLPDAEVAVPAGLDDALAQDTLQLELEEPESGGTEAESVAGEKSPAALTDSQEQAMAAEEARADAEHLAVQGIGPHSTPEQKRTYHWTQRFRSFATTEFYASANAAIRRTAETLKLEHPPLASPNFQGNPVIKGRMWTGAMDLFELARRPALDTLLIEDWTWSPYKVAFGMGIMRAAAAKHELRTGALIVGAQVETRFLAGLAQGSRAWLSYLYGPDRTIGPPWADHNPTVEQFNRVSRWLARHDDALAAASPRPPQAGILIDNNTEIDSIFLPTRLWERQEVFAVLADSHIPAEPVSAQQILEDDALDRYKVLYVTDSHVRPEAQEKIKAWVAQGGVLWSSYAALVGEPCDVRTDRFNEVFGLASRPAPPAWDAKAPRPDPPVISVPASDLIPQPATLTSLLPPMTWTLSTAATLGTYADGTPALVHNRFGNGHAFLFGSTPGIAASGFNHTQKEPEDAPAKRQVISLAARLAGVEQHAVVSGPRVMAFLHDGDGYSVLYLINSYESAQDDLKVTVAVKGPVTEAVDGDGRPVAMKQQSPEQVELTLDLGLHQGAIVVLRY